VSWVDEEFLGREREKLSSEAFFRREYYCEFMDVEGGLFSREQIESMFGDEGAEEMRRAWQEEVDVMEGLDVLERIQRRVW